MLDSPSSYAATLVGNTSFCLANTITSDPHKEVVVCDRGMLAGDVAGGAAARLGAFIDRLVGGELSFTQFADTPLPGFPTRLS